ncbi:TPA: hypothetical protein ACPY5Y_000893 [Yersinia enterocolitica]|nr:hypothetical protein [Yersinia enterocolitica]
MTKEFEEKFTKEKSLWDVYRMTKNIEPTWFNIIVILLIFSILSINSFLISSEKLLITSLQSWVLISFNFSASMLGFLITGFTIFATLNKPDFFLKLMKFTHENSGLPYLKYVYGVFMKVFICFTTYIMFYLSIIMFAQTNGPLSEIVKIIPYGADLKSFFVKITYVAVGCSAVYLVLIIKTFIFNIYAILMNSLRWEYHSNKRKSKDEQIIDLLKIISLNSNNEKLNNTQPSANDDR